MVDELAEFSGRHDAASVESCIAEVADFLSDLSNWDGPVFPDVEGCRPLSFIPDRLDLQATSYNCDHIKKGEAIILVVQEWVSQLKH